MRKLFNKRLFFPAGVLSQFLASECQGEKRNDTQIMLFNTAEKELQLFSCQVERSFHTICRRDLKKIGAIKAFQYVIFVANLHFSYQFILPPPNHYLSMEHIATSLKRVV